MTNLRRVWNQILWTRLACTPYITVTDLNDDEQIHPGVLSYVTLWLGVSLPDWMQPGTAPTFFLQPARLHTTLLRWAPGRHWTQGGCRRLQALGQAIISNFFMSQWEVRPPPWPRSYNFGYSPAKERALTAMRDLLQEAIWEMDPGATFRAHREWHVSWASPRSIDRAVRSRRWSVDRKSHSANPAVEDRSQHKRWRPMSK